MHVCMCSSPSSGGDTGNNTSPPQARLQRDRFAYGTMPTSAPPWTSLWYTPTSAALRDSSSSLAVRGCVRQSHGAPCDLRAQTAISRALISSCHAAMACSLGRSLASERPTQIVRRTNKSCSVLTICAWRPLLSLGGIARPWTPAFDSIAVKCDPMLTLYLLSAIALKSDGHEVRTARP